MTSTGACWNSSVASRSPHDPAHSSGELASFVAGRKKGGSRKNLDAFVNRTGKAYEDALALDSQLCDVYRNGLADEYAVKGDCYIATLKGREECAVGRDGDGRYYFVMERYFDDFIRAAGSLYQRTPTTSSHS
jgi:hypothetical protein